MEHPQAPWQGQAGPDDLSPTQMTVSMKKTPEATHTYLRTLAMYAAESTPS